MNARLYISNDPRMNTEYRNAECSNCGTRFDNEGEESFPNCPCCGRIYEMYRDMATIEQWRIEAEAARRHAKHLETVERNYRITISRLMERDGIGEFVFNGKRYEYLGSGIPVRAHDA